MSEWRRTPLAMHQRRGAGGGMRACGARREQRESGEGRRKQREHRRWYCTRGGSKERAERGEGSRESIADGTALRDIVGEEVAATFGALHHYDEGLFVYVAMLPTLLPIGVPGNFNSWGERSTSK